MCSVFKLFVPTSKALCRFHERKHFSMLQVRSREPHFVTVYWTFRVKTLVPKAKRASLFTYLMQPADNFVVSMSVSIVVAAAG
jgi:hypothetical protein